MLWETPRRRRADGTKGPLGARELLGGVEIEDEGVVEDGFEQGDKVLMYLMIDVGLDVCFVFEGEDPHVGEAFIEVFFADVGAPFE